MNSLHQETIQFFPLCQEDTDLIVSPLSLTAILLGCLK